MNRTTRALTALTIAIAVAALGATAALAATSPSSGARPHAKHLGVRKPSRTAHVRIRDGVTSKTPRRARMALRAARIAGSGGSFQTANGDTVTVYLSPQFTADPTVNQSFADFVSGLIHGSEISDLTIYVAPLAEMQSICSTDANACYVHGQELMVVPGDSTPDGTPLEDLVAHEYGHHIALNRLNDVGWAEDWGPEYWATHEGVCYREDVGTAFPGDEDANYSFNPGEAWAETYRVLNGFNPSGWGIVDQSFFPDDGALAAAQRDVLQPFQGDEYVNRNGRFNSRGSRWRQFTVPVQNDGTVDLRLTGARRLDADLYIYADGQATQPLASSRRYGHNEHLTSRFCGYRRLLVAVYRYSGSGSYKLRVTLPYTT
jgi:hypothetical protein